MKQWYIINGMECTGKEKEQINERIEWQGGSFCPFRNVQAACVKLTKIKSVINGFFEWYEDKMIT